MIKRLGAAFLSALIAALSFGPEAACAAAAEFGAKGAPAGSAVVLPEIPKITSLSELSSVTVLPHPLAELGAMIPETVTPQGLHASVGQMAAGQPQVPLDAPLPPQTDFAAEMGRLAAPSLVGNLSNDAPAEEAQGAGFQDFSEHVLGERTAAISAADAEPEVEVQQLSGALMPVSGKASKPRKERVAKPQVQARSPVLPAVVGGVFAAAALALKAAAGLFVPAFSALSFGGSAAVSIPHVALLAASAILAIPAAVFLPRAAWESAQYGWAMRRGRKVTDDDFRRFVEGEVLAGRLDGGIARLIRIYRPEKITWDMGLGYHSAGAIALRPELAATPMLFRSVLAHEFRHYQELKARGPPAGGFFGGLWRRSVSEVTARAIELHGTKALKDSKVPGLERALRESQLSLNLDQPYELLVVNAENAELKDPALYRSLSSGRAKVETLASLAPQDVLGEAKNARRYKAVVMEKPDALLPKTGTLDAKKLDLALAQLDSLYLLATRRMANGDGAFKPGTSEVRRFRELAEIAKTMTKGSKKDVKRLERMVKDFWHQIASTRLKGVGPADFIEKLYDGLQDKGMAFLSFGPTDPGVVVWEKLLRYWEAGDGGEFRTVRVDLEDGGHIMILRKVEARVGLWLQPRNGGSIETSVPDASATPDSRSKARQALAKAGFSDQLDAFAKLQAAAKGESDRLAELKVLADVRSALALASRAGKITDPNAFSELWLRAGIIAEARQGAPGVKWFDELSRSYQKTVQTNDPAALKEVLTNLDYFVLSMVVTLDRGALEAVPDDIRALIAKARVEVEAAQSADSLAIFDKAAAALNAASPGPSAFEPALKTFTSDLGVLRASLERSGMRNYLRMLDDLGVEIRDVFGGGLRQQIYVTIPRRNAAAIQKFVAGSSIMIGNSRADFETHLMDSAKIQNVPEAWNIGVTGGGATVMEIDTGGKTTHEDYADRDDGVDMMHEGHEDWIGHRTHVGGIVASANPGFLGMAKAVRSIGAKVFGRDSPGASDGDIMGAGAIALERGVDVINLSLGSRGNSSDNLAKFFSALTLRKNSKGEYVVVVASAGNSGPFDESISQPAAGENVIAVAAASKSEDDGVPEISFFSSVGPDRPSDSAIEWIEIKPDITAIGGDVVTDPGDPNVYKHGVMSAKSKDMPAGPSDMADKKHTGMSGTSMAAPMISGIAALVKLALKTARAVRDFVYENLPLSVKAILMVTAKDMGVPVWFQGAGFVDAGSAVKLALSGVSGSVRFRLSKLPGLTALAPEAGADSWAWIERYKSVIDLGNKVRRTAEVAKTEARARFEDQPSADDEDARSEDKPAIGDKVYAEIVQKFSAAREEALPALLDALKDPVWLVRRQAALVLLNLKSAKSAAALLESATTDADSRVRQMAWLALAKINAPAVLAGIKQAAADPRWDVSIYAAYALAARGDASEVGLIAAASRFADDKVHSKGKQARYSAAWLLGQLGGMATKAEAQALSAKVKDLGERGNIRHLAAASLYNLAQAAPGSIGDDALVDLLSAAGPQNLALTRTIAKFFPAAMQDRRILALMRQEPVKSVVMDFVLKNRAAAQSPGALGELVALLAKNFDIPLDVPTPLPDAGGLGVPGVDPAIGPLDVIVDVAQLSNQAHATPYAAAGLDSALLARYSSVLQAALPISKAYWVRVPEHKLFAFSLEMRRLGFVAKLSRPYYPTAAPASPSASAGLLLDVGTERLPAPAGGDLSMVRITAAHAVSEAKVMAALEEVLSRAGDPLKNPTLVTLALAGPALKKDGRPLRGPLGELVNSLVLANVQVVVSAGNGGPAEDSIASPADAGLAVAVAAAGEKTGLQFYSARGTIENPGVFWTDLVRDADLASLAKAATEAAMSLGKDADAAPAFGTGAAAERSAGKLASLTRRAAVDFLAKNGSLPDGFYFYIVGLIRQTLSSMPAHKVNEVGGGFFGDEARALALLEEGLKDPAKVARDAEALIGQARGRFAPGMEKSQNGLNFWNRMKDPYARASNAVIPRGLHPMSSLARRAAERMTESKP